MNHREFIQSLSPEQRKQLTERSDVKGLVQLAQHWSLIFLLALLVVNKVTAWPLLLLPLGIVLVFQFTLMHEAIHHTPFRSRWINQAVATVCGYVLVLPPHWFRYFHLEHHRHTHVLGKDPELASPKPQNRREYWLYVSGLPLWWGSIKTLWTNACGQCVDSYVPNNGRGKVKREALLMMAFYAAVIALSLLLGSAVLLTIWVIPLLLGQPFLRLYLLAEHTDCQHTDNMLSNTRTVYTSASVRWLAWNMPYHAEHHSFAAVPFHRLPRLNELIHGHLAVTSKGYWVFHNQIKLKH